MSYIWEFRLPCRASSLQACESGPHAHIICTPSTALRHAGRELFQASAAAEATQAAQRGRFKRSRKWLEGRHRAHRRAHMAAAKSEEGRARVEARKQLPAFAARDELLQAVADHQVGPSGGLR